jgi:coenzyme F420-dependent glucose-6-phosphate dehydrogenase
MIQLHLSWGESRSQAEEQAVRERPNGGMGFPKADIREPEDFQAMVSIENRVLTSADLDEVYAQSVGRDQVECIRACGGRMIPKLDWPEKG